MPLALSTLRLALVIEQMLRGEHRSSSQEAGSPLGLNPTQVLILVSLSMHSRKRESGWYRGAATPTALSKFIGCSRSTLAMQLRTMRRLGLLEEVQLRSAANPAVPPWLDGRTRLYALTSLGTTAARRAQRLLADVDALLGSLLTVKQSESVDRSICDVLDWTAGFEAWGNLGVMKALAEDTKRSRLTPLGRRRRTR